MLYILQVLDQTISNGRNAMRNAAMRPTGEPKNRLPIKKTRIIERVPNMMLGNRAVNSLTPNSLNERATEYVNNRALLYLNPEGSVGSPVSKIDLAA